MAANDPGTIFEPDAAFHIGVDTAVGHPRVALVADDEPLVRRLVCSVLARYGWETIETTDGAEALGVSIDEDVDLLVTDYHMSSITGLELAREIRSRTPDLPILLISGRPDLDEVARSLGYGFLAKPFELAELLSAVDALIEPQIDLPVRAPAEEAGASLTDGTNSRGAHRC